MTRLHVPETALPAGASLRPFHALTPSARMLPVSVSRDGRTKPRRHRDCRG
jgi:hypothetical protein